MKQINLIKQYNLILFYFISFLYLELLFKYFIGYKIFTNYLASIILYTFITSLITFLISKLINIKINKIISFIIIIFTCLYFCIQFGSYTILKVYFTIASNGNIGDILLFKKELYDILVNNYYNFILLFIPLIVLIAINKKLDYNNLNKKNIIISSTSVVVGLIIYMLTLSDIGVYTPKKLTFDYKDMTLSVEKLGLINSGQLDLIKTMTNFQEKAIFTNQSIDNSIVLEQQFALNILDINFENINANDTLESMSQYFSNQTGTVTNEYTGMFEGKNLILILAESFSDIAVSEELTPTLYKMMSQGFNFENFYSPNIYSTQGGEYQLMTGLYPTTDALEIFKKGANTYTQTLPIAFSSLGYATNFYHNYKYQFNNRDLYVPSLGYDNYLACGNGLEETVLCSWVPSDLEMIDTTFDLYSDNESFFTTYTTMSGHGSYSQYHSIAKKNIDLIPDEYSSKARHYLAAQLELEFAITSLVEQLDNEGLLEDTVFVLAGDHLPYLLSNEEINELSSYYKDDTIDIHKSPLIIWNSEMEPVTINKIGSQIDILPTIFNLFGIEYDSRIIIGNDILSTEPGLAIFSDKSWISDQGRYHALTDEYFPSEGYQYDQEYVDLINDIVSTRTRISSLITTQDYYKYIKQELN